MNFFIYLNIKIIFLLKIYVSSVLLLFFLDAKLLIKFLYSSLSKKHLEDSILYFFTHTHTYIYIYIQDVYFQIGIYIPGSASHNIILYQTIDSKSYNVHS